jgi:hypothetical protein
VVVQDSGRVLLWTPRLQDSGGTFFIPVKATDAGVPNMSITNIFRVIVQPPLGFECLSWAGNTFEFRWLVHPGKTYELQWTESLSVTGASRWTTLETVSGLTANTWFTNSIALPAPSVRSNRFFRVLGY